MAISKWTTFELDVIPCMSNLFTIVAVIWLASVYVAIHYSLRLEHLQL